ncbi:hypothetical protein Moror_11924 [Moniliophthora roreri MCA 2997]|uniref:Uncharacterized protein n=1 Tax=Moniliophthora roreri (strain MCA 2997) TaxID=1381753 RepID=V2WJR1_MONRO|nr:hypothetical protein Moror_11924 [Moniliophthora roreri MCA 2997]
MFNRSSGFSFSGNNTFTNAHGHQFNGPVTAGVINYHGQAVTKRTKYNQFREVIQGDMITLKELGSEDLSEWDSNYRNGKKLGRLKAQAKVCTVKVYPDRQSKFTAIVYEGEDAKKLWRKDFRHFSRNKKPGSFQLFGINQSAIPALIFHYELIPCAQFFNEKSIWMDVYIEHLRTNMRCWQNNLWMNTAGGVLFSGPDGPEAPDLASNADESIIVPTTVDMLKDDTCIRFFINFGSSVDGSVLVCAQMNSEFTYLDNLFPATAEDYQSKDSDHPNWSSATHPYLRRLWRNPPDRLPINVIGGLRFDTVYSSSMEAVARWPPGAGSLWEWYERMGLVEETVLDGGLTRFKLDLTRGEEVYLEARDKWRRFRQGWLSQSSRVFNAVDVTEGKEKFFTVESPWLKIQSTQHPTTSRTFCNDEYLIEETSPTPVYLFLHPLPISVSGLVSWIEGQPYFWSFDETGQSRMSEEECERWRLPVLTASTHQVESFVRLVSWPTYVYTTLQDWQKARGFDPATSDWARELGYPEWGVVGTRKVREQKKVGHSWWQWEAIAGTEISAFGF